MKTKTIVFWGREDIWSCSIEHFLTIQNGWNVLNISYEENLEAMIAIVDKVNPDVVVIHQDNCVGELDLPTILTQKHPGLKVIAFRSDNNTMEVYSKQNFLVNSASDFISVVRADLMTLAEH